MNHQALHARKLWTLDHPDEPAPVWVAPTARDLATVAAIAASSTGAGWGEIVGELLAELDPLALTWTPAPPPGPPVHAGLIEYPAPIHRRTDPHLWTWVPVSSRANPHWLPIDDEWLDEEAEAQLHAGTPAAHWATELIRWWQINAGPIWSETQEPLEERESPIRMAPSFQRAKPESNQLKLLNIKPAPPQGPEQLILPGIGIGGRSAQACPGWMLNLFDQAGGMSLTKGRGAPLELRLFVAALLHLPAHLRGHEGTRSYVVEASQVEQWAFPGGIHNFGRDWSRIPEALYSLHNLRVLIAGHAVSPVTVPVIPMTREAVRTGKVAFTVYVPPGAEAGARIHFPVLAQYGLASAPLYRAYLAAQAVVDFTARRGQPIKVSHSERAKNRIASFSSADMIRMVGHQNSRHSGRAIAAFEEIAADGHIELVRTGRRWQIFGR